MPGWWWPVRRVAYSVRLCRNASRTGHPAGFRPIVDGQVAHSVHVQTHRKRQLAHNSSSSVAQAARRRVTRKSGPPSECDTIEILIHHFGFVISSTSSTSSAKLLPLNSLY